MPQRWSFALAFVLAVGCGGPQFDGRTYRNDSLAFRLGPIPAGWRQLEARHALLAFRDDATSATIGIGGRCGKDGDDVPLEALTHHLFIHFTERDVESQERLSLDGRDALRTQMLAKLDGVPKRFTVYVLKKDGCVYDLLHIADTTGGGQSQFDSFAAGFRTLE